MDKRSKAMLFSSQLSTQKQKCIAYEENSEVYKKAEGELLRLNNVLIELKEYYRDLDIIQRTCLAEYANHKKTRVEYIENAINHKLHSIFPNDKYIIKISFDPKVSEKVSFGFVDETGEPRSMVVSAGGMMQSVIPSSVYSTISDALGFNILWSDEGNAASDMENLIKVNEQLKTYLEQGYQMFLIEHRPDGYSNLPRREFHLEKDVERKMISEFRIVDFD